MGNKAIVIFGGHLVKDANGLWKTTNFDESDEYGVLGDRLRIEAGSFLYQENKQLTVIALGGRGQLAKIPDAPAVSEIIKSELVKLNVPEKNIITENESGSTYDQLREMKKIIRKKNFGEAVIISNKYHLPRIRAMIEQWDRDLADWLYQGKISLLAAEEVIIKYQPERAEEIKRAYDTVAMRERIGLEQKGVSEIKAGTYKLRLS